MYSIKSENQLCSGVFFRPYFTLCSYVHRYVNKTYIYSCTSETTDRFIYNNEFKSIFNQKIDRKYKGRTRKYCYLKTAIHSIFRIFCFALFLSKWIDHNLITPWSKVLYEIVALSSWRLIASCLDNHHDYHG
jgi:hypothetical protein